MRLHILPFAALLLLSPSPARAQVRLGISIGLPMAPRLEVIAPGIQVITGFEEEVFLQGGWYWARRSDGWYRSRNGRGSFDYVESRRVPRGLVRMPRGHYRNWHHEGWDRGGNRDHRRQERRHDERERRNEGGHGHH